MAAPIRMNGHTPNPEEIYFSPLGFQGYLIGRGVILVARQAPLAILLKNCFDPFLKYRSPGYIIKEDMLGTIGGKNITAAFEKAKKEISIFHNSDLDDNEIHKSYEVLRERFVKEIDELESRQISSVISEMMNHIVSDVERSSAKKQADVFELATKYMLQNLKELLNLDEITEDTLRKYLGYAKEGLRKELGDLCEDGNAQIIDDSFNEIIENFQQMKGHQNLSSEYCYESRQNFLRQNLNDNYLIKKAIQDFLKEIETPIYTQEEAERLSQEIRANNPGIPVDIDLSASLFQDQITEQVAIDVCSDWQFGRFDQVAEYGKAAGEFIRTIDVMNGAVADEISRDIVYSIIENIDSGDS